MSAIDLAAVVVTITCLVVVGVGTAYVLRLRAALRAATDLLDRVSGQVDSEMQRLDRRGEQIDEELRRVDGLLARADQVSARAETLSRITYGAVARPVIRTAAVVKGTSRAARLLRGDNGGAEKAPVEDNQASRRAR